MRISKAIVAILAIFASICNAATMTMDNGAPVGDNQNSQTSGVNGPTLLQDIQLLQKLQRFDRERIPERVVHARGVGVFGYFIASNGLSDYTRATVFKKGTQTPVFVRFSTVIASRGGSEVDRDPRGFATKFYTNQGNWDLVGNNLPIFFIRDAMKFPDMVHSLKPDPVTNVQDPNRYFDFFSHQPEATAMLTRLYSDYGTPANYRQMDGSSVHALKLVRANGEYVYAKFTWKSKQGIRNLRPQELAMVQGKSVSNATIDLYDSIRQHNYPRWDLYVQIIKPADLNSYPFNPLDATKVWAGVPETKVGIMILNKIPDNFFETSEEVAMSPANMVPGIEPSEDRLLQGRLFSYADTQTYRLGTNFQSLPINRPRVAVINNNRDGLADNAVRKGNINYDISSANKIRQDVQYKRSVLPLNGTTVQQPITKTLNFAQSGEFYRSLTQQDKDDLIYNLSVDLNKLKDENIKYTMLSYFYKADSGYGTALAQATHSNIDRVASLASKLSQ